MKKLVILMLFILLIYPTSVLAEEVTEKTNGHEVYLLDLSIDGYDISPKFDKYNSIYTLIINENLTNLDVLYTLESNATLVEVIGNNDLTLGENHIFINLLDAEGSNSNSYEIIVTLKDESLLPVFGEFLTSDENHREINEIEVSLIVIGAFVAIMIVFRILFIRKIRS